MIALATVLALLSIAAGTVDVVTSSTAISNSGAMFSMNGVNCPGTVVKVQQAAALWVTNSRIGAIEMPNDMANFEQTIIDSFITVMEREARHHCHFSPSVGRIVFA